MFLRLIPTLLAVMLTVMALPAQEEQTPPRAVPVEETQPQEPSLERSVQIIEGDGQPLVTPPRAIPVETESGEAAAPAEAVGPPPAEVVEMPPGRTGTDGLPIDPMRPIEVRVLSPKPMEILPSTHVDIFLDVQNYLLKEEGNRLHVIINNDPPVEVVDAVRPLTLPRLGEGGNTVRVFAVRPDGTMIRDPKAYAMTHFYVRRRDFTNYTDPAQPYLTVNLPLTGEIETDAQGRICFDYMIHNADWQSGPSHRIRYRIGPFEGFLNEPGPVYWSNLTTGRHTLQVELFDANNQAVFGPFNTVERQFQVRQILRAVPIEQDMILIE